MAKPVGRGYFEHGSVQADKLPRVAVSAFAARLINRARSLDWQRPGASYGKWLASDRRVARTAGNNGFVAQAWQGSHPKLSQRSFHFAPIFRLLLKVAVNETHQCDFHNF